MATTPNRNYPYYAGSDIPAGMTQQQNFALAVDADVAALVSEAGLVTVPTATTVTGTGFQVRVRLNRVEFIGTLALTSGNFVAGNSYVVCNAGAIPVAARPAVARNTDAIIAGSGNAYARAYVDVDGSLTLVVGSANSSYFSMRQLSGYRPAG